MWFKNLQLFRLTKPFSLSPETLAEHLQEGAFRECGSLEPASYGWAPPFGRHSSQLVHAANGCLLICARREEKVLPPAVVREVLDERVEAIEADQARRVRRKEKDALRDEVLQDLLPKAFTRSTYTYAYLAPEQGWLVVDAATARRAEDLANLLRQALGSFPVMPPAVRQAPAAVMTRWVERGGLCGHFELADECVLRDSADEGCVARCKRQDLSADEVHAHLKAGKQVVELAVGWNERLWCVLNEDLAVKRLRFADVVREEAGDLDEVDEITRLDNDFVLMTLELGNFFPRLLELFGGEDEKAYGLRGA